MSDRIKMKKLVCCGITRMSLAGIHGDSEIVTSRQKKSSLRVDAAGMG